MLALFIGGIKSGKSKEAELYTIKHSKTKPIYLATTEFIDSEMAQKIKQHKLQREDNFITYEEPLHLAKILQDEKGMILIECVSMWLNNMLYHNYSQDEILKEIDEITKLDCKIVFVINDVSCSVVSEHKLVREFVNLSGKISQLLASKCSEVFQVTAGISVKIK